MVQLAWQHASSAAQPPALYACIAGPRAQAQVWQSNSKRQWQLTLGQAPVVQGVALEQHAQLRAEDKGEARAGLGGNQSGGGACLPNGNAGGGWGSAGGSDPEEQLGAGHCATACHNRCRCVPTA